MATINIKQGDTLSGLAQQYGTTVGEIMKTNPAIKNPNLIRAGGTLTIAEKPQGPPQQALPGTLNPTPPGSPNLLPEQNKGAEALGQLGNLRLAMRFALDEAAQQTAKSRMESLSGFVSGGAAPSVIKAAIGLAQGGLASSRADIMSDVERTISELSKEVKFDASRYKEVRGGIYDLIGNKWIVNPTSGTGGTGGGEITTTVNVDGKPTKILSATRQVIDGFTNLTDLTPTEQQKVRTELYKLGYNSTEPPPWFRDEEEQRTMQSSLPAITKNDWNIKRNKTLYGNKFLTTEFFKGLFGEEGLKKSAKAGKMSNDEYLQGLMQNVQTYRDAGFSDEDILKMMK